MLNGYTPIFSQFGTDIYASDVVQQALGCIVKEMKKLNPRHIRMVGADPIAIKGDVQDVLREPNPLMSTSDFLEKICWLLLLNYNVFILPVYYTWTDEKTGAERRYYKELYPIQPEMVEFIEDASGTLFTRFTFMNGEQTTIRYSDVIHIKYNYSVNDYMGGDYSGQPDHRPLLKTLQLNHSLLEGVAKALNASYAINGIIKYNTLIDDGDTAQAVEAFNQKLQKSESGFIPFDLKSEVIPFERKIALVDDKTLKFIDEKILRNFGVPLDILRGDYTQEQYNAFYQSTLEPLIISIGQAFTKKIFTAREKSFGNEIKLYPKELILMSVDQTLEMINILSPTGGLYENEKRAALGLPPLPELTGKRYMSLNWIDADNAAQYQTGESIDVVDEVKQDI